MMQFNCRRSVMLINPSISSNGFSSFDKDNSINHGIASIASYLEDNRCNVEYIDLRRLVSFKEIRTILKKTKINIFGITSMTSEFGFAIKVAKIIKKCNKNNIVIIGGIHVTLCPKDAIKKKCFDYIITGEGEIKMLELIKNIIKNKASQRLIKGVPMDANKIPMINRDLFYFREGEINNPIIRELPVPYATIITSRGCPFNCNFCQPAERMISGGVVRYKNIKDVINELILLNDKYKIKSFLIHDDLFFVNPDRITEFIKLYKLHKFKFKFVCQARSDLIVKNSKELNKLKEIGLVCVLIGFESGSQRILNFINKQTTVSDNYNATKICRNFGVKVWANYMLGIPTESYIDMIRTLYMVLKISPEYHSPTFFTPFPNTFLYDYCKKNNLLIFKKYSDYRRDLYSNKIKGFNYNLMRSMLFFVLPLTDKFRAIRYIFNKIRDYCLMFLSKLFYCFTNKVNVFY